MISLTPVILAGGSGTRLWPLSREDYPKQLLSLVGDSTLLQQTVQRLDGLGDVQSIETSRPLLVCHEKQRFLILEQLAQIERESQGIILEPVSRNTAPALTIAALALTGEGADPVMLVNPADHLIDDVEKFHEAIVTAAALAANSMIVTFGIVPTRPETGYGYIRKGIGVQPKGNPAADNIGFSIDGFVEKPGRDAAKSYVASGKYLWNSGMFVMRASVWLEAIDRHRTDILSASRLALEAGGVDGSFRRVGVEAFEQCPSDSIDFAVMERITDSYLPPAADGREGEAIPAAVVALDAGWSDLGSWPTLFELGESDSSGNVTKGDVYTHDTKDSLVVSNNRLVATVGLDHAVVVETDDAVLVTTKGKSEGVRAVVDWLREHDRPEGKTHPCIYRPWGSFEQLDVGDGYQVKRLSVKPGAALSLQMHNHRAEHWIVVRGTARVTRDNDVFDLSENESTFIPLGAKHRLENLGSETLDVIEVQSGSYLGEDDIVRFEDKYNR